MPSKPLTGAKPANAKRIGVFAGSFDPVTLGHLDVIERASCLFDELIVAVGEARDKSPLFSLEERLSMLRVSCKRVPQVTVASFSGLVADFARAEAATALVRGIRSEADYSYEMTMERMNRALNPHLITVFLPTNPEHTHISSSLAKEIAKHGGDANLLVPPIVSKKLTEKLKSKK